MRGRQRLAGGYILLSQGDCQGVAGRDTRKVITHTDLVGCWLHQWNGFIHVRSYYVKVFPPSGNISSPMSKRPHPYNLILKSLYPSAPLGLHAITRIISHRQVCGYNAAGNCTRLHNSPRRFSRSRHGSARRCWKSSCPQMAGELYF